VITDVSVPPLSSGPEDESFGQLVRPRSRLQLRPAPAWPIVALVALWPLWWAMGLSAFILVILAVPMTVILLRRRPIRVPPGFGIWVVFLIWSIGSVAMLWVQAPHTLVSSGSSRLLPFGLRNLDYLGMTVVLLYVGNLSDRVMSRSRMIKLLGLMFIYAVVGGFLGLLAPHLSFTSPVEKLLPGSLRANQYVLSIVHPATAQIESVLGSSAPRPEAPFEYTNTWGNNLSVLLPWFVIAWGVIGKKWQRWTFPVVLLLACVPLIDSLNRGVWIGIGLTVGYVCWRAVVAGRPAIPLAVVGALVVAFGLFAVTPLATTVVSRLQHPHSNSIRSDLSGQAFRAALSSPIVGYGSTRSAIGSTQGIGIGKSATCVSCGNAPIGSNGQLWLLLIANGFVGTALYFGFFMYPVWRYRRDRTAIGIAGRLVLLLSLFYALVYSISSSTLIIVAISMAMLWRNDQAGRAPLSDDQPADGSTQGIVTGLVRPGRPDRQAWSLL
jgi:hypothetical protein